MTRPAANKGQPTGSEPFLSPAQVAHFRDKLRRMHDETRQELDAAPAADAAPRDGDQTDQASAAVDREFDIINRERAQALLIQIDQALARLDNGTFGFCEETGEPIGLARLEAQPTATLTIEAQARREAKPA